MSLRAPINFKAWIDEHRHLLKPPVGNQVVYTDSEFIIMVVGGPNARTDYHLNNSEEFFYMLEGDMELKVVDEGVFRTIPIREGEIFLLPPDVPHCPVRKADTVGLVIERQRREGERDGLRWYCEECGNVLYEEFFELTDIVTQLKTIIETFYGSEELRTCSSCGNVMQPPSMRTDNPASQGSDQ